MEHKRDFGELTFSYGKRQKVQEAVMGAEYNWLIDNVPIRMALNVVAFLLWLGAMVGLFKLAGA